MLGLIVAESPAADELEAFPKPTRDSLELAGHVVSRALSRSSTLTLSMLDLLGHGLAKPITRASALVAALKDEVTDRPSSRELTSMLETVLRRAQDEIYSYYVVSKIASGDLSVISADSEFLVAEMVKRVVRQSESLSGKVGIDLNLRCGAEVCRADERVVSSCLIELIDNAVKFGEHSSGDKVQVVVSTTERSAEISVSNPGAIPRDKEELIFEPFYRLPEHAVVTGSGLGLWKVGILARAHPGLAVELRCSNPVTFTFSLPRAIKRRTEGSI